MVSNLTKENMKKQFDMIILWKNNKNFNYQTTLYRKEFRNFIETYFGK